MNLLMFAEEVARDIDLITGLDVATRVVEERRASLVGSVGKTRIVTSYRLLMQSLFPERTGRAQMRGWGPTSAVTKGLLRAAVQKKTGVPTYYVAKRRWRADSEMQATLALVFAGFLELLVSNNESEIPTEGGAQAALRMTIEMRALRWGFRMHDPLNVLALAAVLEDLDEADQEILMARLILLVGGYDGVVEPETFVQLIRQAINPDAAVH